VRKSIDEGKILVTGADVTLLYGACRDLTKIVEGSS
jgi:hypothetical protein